MKNTFTKLTLVGALAVWILGIPRPATAALVVTEIGRRSEIFTIIEWNPNGTASGTRATYMSAPGLFESQIATNTIHSLAIACASASHVCDFRTNQDSIHLTFDGQGQVSHNATSPSDGISALAAESAFSATLAFSADTEFSYTLIPFRSASLTNADASILFEPFDPDQAYSSNYVGVGAGIRPSGITVWETNATMALSGVAPAGDYVLYFDIGTEAIDEISSTPANAGFASLSGFEFRATTLPTPTTPPRLEASLVGGNMILSWPMACHAFDVEEARAIDSATWSPVAGTRMLVGDRLVVTVETPGASRFFRLKGRL
jgi:hypothetical protein